jgi:hypothetical protein
MHFEKLSFSTLGSVSILQFKTENKTDLEIKTINELLETKEIEISEVSTSGNVNSIIVDNMSKFYLFLMDGDILRGAKQNRILNTTVLVAPEKKLEIPVSCVERGRWSNRSFRFDKSDHTVSPDFRAIKSSLVNDNFKKNKKHYADQAHIWAKIENDLYHKKLQSETRDYESIYLNDKKLFKNQFPLSQDANGIAVFYGNSLLNADIFGNESLYQKYFDRILDAASVYLDKTIKFSPSDEQIAVDNFYKDMYFAEESIVDSGNGVGEGIEKRFENKNTCGFELTYNNCLIHYTLFNKNL